MKSVRCVTQHMYVFNDSKQNKTRLDVRGTFPWETNKPELVQFILSDWIHFLGILCFPNASGHGAFPKHHVYGSQLLHTSQVPSLLGVTSWDVSVYMCAHAYAMALMEMSESGPGDWTCTDSVGGKVPLSALPSESPALKTSLNEKIRRECIPLLKTFSNTLVICYNMPSNSCISVNYVPLSN